MPDSTDNPFTYADAEVIVRSSDGVDLKLHKSILSVASPFFSTLFSLPQPSIETSVTMTPPNEESSLPVIAVTEDARTLCGLFRLVYPIAEADLSTLPQVAAVFGAAKKYQLEQAFLNSQKQMLAYAESHPLRTYMLGCFFKDAKITRAAARASRSLQTVVRYVDEMDSVTASDFCRLLIYKEQNVQDLFKNFDWIPRGIPSVQANDGTQPETIAWNAEQKPNWFRCESCSHTEEDKGGYWREDGKASEWWEKYMARVATELQNDDSQGGACAVSSENVAEALHEGSTCEGGCAADESVQAFHAFTRYLAGEIDKKVYIELKF